MDIKGLNLGGVVSPARGSIKDISNLPQLNQGDGLSISNADVEKAPSIDITSRSTSGSEWEDDPIIQTNPNWRDEPNWFTAKGMIQNGLPQMSAHLEDSTMGVEAMARQLVGDKEWDVSINENDELVIYGDDLTDDERETLGALLQDAGVDDKLIETRDLMITAFAGVQSYSGNDWRTDIFDHFTMDKSSFGQVFRLREHIEDAKQNLGGGKEYIKDVRHLWGAADSLFSQIKQRGDINSQVSKGYVIDTHA